ncbi:putative leucine-rich repeat receptor-like serine/threonine-protein kinase [Panicum miliaceum]|uniref:non-specific serine/threonine protein kinase n=1 Tax=Panicum miliaceum TaxID=4540 RepID=A0A3L6RYL2_PANMI|nr:putative leucine-rich repeat receptor-like serine/threonine-protein kinase [Panicum miliaceum]
MATTHINLRTNSLTGETPFSTQCRLPYLKKIILYENRLVGLIPSSISNFTSLDWVLLQSNFLGGEMPSQMFNTMPSLKYLYLSSNNFSSDGGNTNLEPFLASLVNCTSLEELGVDSNSIGGKIPPMVGNLSTNLTKIYLYDNKITGAIPHAIGNLPLLTDLCLENNMLEGPIPSEIFQPRWLTRLVLSNNQINGQIPTGVAGLSSLQIYLNVSNNLLEGPLPLELGNMDKIQAPDLSMNKLSAAIPAQTIKGCAAVEYVNLSRNFLQGTLPSSIGALPSSLHVLDVSFNRLTGMIPQSLQASPVLWFANFSYNNFTGEVSSEGAFANLTGDSFLGNPGLCGSILGLAPCSGKHDHLLYIAMIVVVAIAAGLLAMVSIVDHDQLKNHLRLTAPSIQLSRFPTGPVNAVGEKEGEHPRISYRELIDATDGFSEVNLIGKGGYGHVYRGVLHGGTVIAVKVLHQVQVGGEVIAGSFERECQVLRSIRHRNLIRVITTCGTPDFKAVVLPFMPSGSLDGLIHGPPAGGGGKPEGLLRLDLDLLLSIASDVAEGVAYLHHHAPVKVVHCDLKPSNVLLDADMTAVVSDFGISKLVATDARDPEMGEASMSGCSSITRLLQGSVGYIAPEYGLGGRPSTQGDVYSFGVMLLEMISGKRPTDVIAEEGHGLHDWARNRHLQHGVDAVAERSLPRDPPSVLPFGPPGREMEAVVVMELLDLGVACSQLAPSMRPAMDDAAHEIACLRDGTWRKYRANNLKAIDQTKSKKY